METRRITRMGLLVALSLILSYVETILPSFFSIPGIKMGLANIAIVFALYSLPFLDTLFISVLRVFISSLLFGSVLSLIYSLSGAILSLVVMALMKKSKVFSHSIVSIVGACVHNMAQIAVAIYVVGSFYIAYYIPFLLLSGIVTGFIIGLLTSTVLVRIEKMDNFVIS